jgi:N-acetylglutamate synthase-like GNAT family acetyltransferase
MDLIFRSLKESDIPAILEISRKTWSGHDHLPLIIHSWLSNPSCHPIVIEVEGTVAAVSNLKSIDNGDTGWMEGLRVHPNMRERGLAKRLTNRLVEIAQEEEFKRIRLVTAKDIPIPQKLARDIGMRVIENYCVFWKHYGRGVKWIKDDPSISEIDSSKVLDFIKANSEIIPTNCLIYHWDVLEANEENINLIGEHASFFIIEGPLGKGFSLGFIHETRQGPEWCFSVYASTSDVFVSTLNYHLKRAREHELKDLMCIHPSHLKQFYNNVKWLKKPSHELELLLFERIL